MLSMGSSFLGQSRDTEGQAKGVVGEPKGSGAKGVVERDTYCNGSRLEFSVHGCQQQAAADRKFQISSAACGEVMAACQAERIVPGVGIGLAIDDDRERSQNPRPLDGLGLGGTLESLAHE